MKKLVLVLILTIALLLPSISVEAATTADVTVTATPQFVAIADNVTSYDFGSVAGSGVYQTNEDYIEIDNTSSVQTDQTIAVTTATWSGGVTWTHSDTATIGADTAGLKANKGGTWGVGDVIIKFTAPNDIATNQAANTDYTYGIQLLAPSSFGDGVEKTITVRVTAASG